MSSAAASSAALTDSDGTGGVTPLDELRARMAQIMGRADGKPTQKTNGENTLPFVRVECEGGPLWQRRMAMERSHHVGRVPVAPGADARGEILSLLALDGALASVDFSDALYFDTETTGLGGAGVVAFLVGLGSYDDAGCFELEQLLLRSPGEERALLVRLRDAMNAASVWISFNGKSFDWPLIRGRYVMQRMKPPEQRPQLDLLHVSRRLHKARIGRCNLKSVESEILGFDRVGDIEGADVAACYTQFLRTGNDEPLRAVVDHNLWDVVSMGALVGLYAEPLERLHDGDLLGLAQTLRRAGALGRAQMAATVALTRGGGGEALRVRGQIAKARGDRAAALADFESSSRQIDDPSVRLELCKLYEHYVKQPDKALALMDAGTGEDALALQKRRDRLRRKSEQQKNPGPVLRRTRG
ncbi:MAG: ribonuclease H-like domain-containing protein [Polyangiaceae bacterium]|nr:ribonuclease H-like domain-containing protein [Polyangiaceae bacterium]